MVSTEKAIAKLGLSQNEVKVYLLLNSQGSTKAGKIAKLANLDRSSCYNALRLLLQRGFASYVLVGKVKYFQATGPKRLLEYLKEQEEDILAVLPDLQAQHKANKVEGQVRLFKGIKGIKAIFLDIIRTGKDNYVFGSEGQFSTKMPEFALQFKRMKKEKNITTKLLCRKGRKELDIQTKDHRYLPNIQESPAVTNIYGDKIAIIIWADEPEGVLIENAAAAKAYKSYFDFMWNHSKEI